MTTQGNKSQQLAKGLFGGLAGAKAKQDGNWERGGHYLELIENVKLDQNRKNETGFFIEKTIVKVIDDDGGEG